jgi:GH43 family beta-xylosidase
LASKITTHFDTFILDAGWSQEKKKEYLTFTAKEPSIDSAWYQEMNEQVNPASVLQYKRGYLNFMHAKCASNGSVF